MWFSCVLLLKSLFQSPLHQHELALTSAPDGKSSPPHLALPPSFCLSNFQCLYYFFAFSLSFESSQRGLLLSHILYLSTYTHILDSLVFLQSGRDTVVGMCHSFIID